MKILLTHGYFLEEDEKEKHINKPYVPLGILYISAYLEAHGFDNEVFDSTFSNRNRLYEYLAEFKPDVIGIYTNLMTKLNVLKIIRHLKDNHPNTKIILGGPEVRASAENFLQRGADIIVVGEGEATMLEIVSFLREDKNADLSIINGIAFRIGEEVTRTPEREKIADINTLPFPNRKKIDMDLYLQTWKKAHGRNAISVNTMRGCPYSYKWCSRAVYGMSYRRRSPKLVADELEYIYNKYSPDNIWFVDDVFTINHKWLREFNDEVRKRKIDLSYECITRADRLNEESISLLRSSGCFRVWIGAESGSQKVIDLMDRRVKVDQVREMIRLASKHGIETGTFIMLGYPGETEADIRETISHLKSANPDHFTITVAYPIKGTELYRDIESLKLNNVEWHEGTDRDVDFKRTYSRSYYDHAVRYVINEVNAFKLYKQARYFGSLKQKLHSWKARMGMQYQKSITG